MTKLRVRQITRWGSVPESLLEDMRLGLDSRAVAAWLAARPDGWEIRIGPLCRRLGVGRDRWRRISSELLAAGYLARTRIHVSGGRVAWLFDFCPQASLDTDEAPPSPPPTGGAKKIKPSDIEMIELELEAANRAAARGERKPVSHPRRYRNALAAQIQAGTFEPSAAALALAAARKAEAERQRRLAEPPPGLASAPQPQAAGVGARHHDPAPSRAAKATPTAAITRCRAALGLT